MKIDYLEIVLNGYFNNSKYLDKYFFREFKKAEKEFFEPDEFFSGCVNVIEMFMGQLQSQVDARKKELYLMLVLKDRTKETIDYANKELSEIGLHNYYVQLSRLTKGRFSFNMPYIDVLKIKNSILQAQTTVGLIKEKTEQIQPLDITVAAHKILMLHELGVLDHLKQNYPVFAQDSDTNLSKLLAPLLGDNIETIRAALKNLNTRTTRTIINKTSVRQVKAELSKLGIETKTLPDL